MPTGLRTSSPFHACRGTNAPGLIYVLILALVFALHPGAAAAQAPAEVAVSIDRWGAGNVIRRGDMAAIRVVLTDLGTRQRELLVRIETRDADGDRPVPLFM